MAHATMRRIKACFSVALLSFLIFGSPAAFAGTVKVPENAHPKGYGSGWECDKSYREKNGSCVAISIPDNAFSTKSKFGQGWECSWGFRQDGARCIALVIPENAFLNSFGDKWKCDRGYRASGDGCKEITVPQNAHLDFSGNGWECNRPYRRVKDKCALR